MSNPQTLRFFRSKLPHWLVAGRAYFVTIRLKGTLPAHILEQLKQQQEDSEKSDIEKRRNLFVKIEHFLDASNASVRLLDNREVADMLLESLPWFESKGWTIYAAVVLSTHMHLLIRNKQGASDKLISHVSAFKSYTGGRANKILDRRGRFWAHDCFDVWIRTPDKFESTVCYIANNPVKAGHVKCWTDWPWVQVHDDVLFCLKN